MSARGGLRWIPPLQLSGCWQMAIDEWLLDRAVACSRGRDGGRGVLPAAVLRFYSWSRPTLSLGWHQRHLKPRWLDLQSRGHLQLVRRPSGGRAVLHAGELTYALVWPGAPVQRREAYHQACSWLQSGFAALGMPLAFGEQKADPDHPSCFASSTAADLVHRGGGKRIGSAQLWRQGVLLQHGSIQLKPDRALWRRVLDEEPPPIPPLDLPTEQLIERLRDAAGQQLNPASGALQEAPLTPAEWSGIATRLERYRVGGGGTTSPEWSIERATAPRARPSG
ncbi:MAG: lipoyl protein ligase domain-containing protein [Cyanobium sp.]